MKKLLLSLVIILALLTSCAEVKTINGVKYDTYGLIDEYTHKNDSIKYEVSTGSVICAIIFCETIIAPVYIIGWNLYQPVGKINEDPKLKGVIVK